MATRVELHIDQVKAALQLKLSSLSRAAKGEPNKLIKELLDKDIAALQAAINTSTDIK